MSVCSSDLSYGSRVCQPGSFDSCPDSSWQVDDCPESCCEPPCCAPSCCQPSCCPVCCYRPSSCVSLLCRPVCRPACCVPVSSCCASSCQPSCCRPASCVSLLCRPTCSRPACCATLFHRCGYFPAGGLPECCRKCLRPCDSSAQSVMLHSPCLLTVRPWYTCTAGSSEAASLSDTVSHLASGVNHRICVCVCVFHRPPPVPGV
uniref:Uncharacterized protein n=1 Tax=Urocitellus parryii TaxID=9999 RepID=A0A8D2IN89_UROPR